MLRYSVAIVLVLLSFRSGNCQPNASHDLGSYPSVKISDFVGQGPIKLEEVNALDPDRSHSIAFVLADEIDLDDSSFDYCAGSAPRQIVLMADTIRIDGTVRFSLASSAPVVCRPPYLGPAIGVPLAPGIGVPSLSLLSKKLIVGANGVLCVHCPEVTADGLVQPTYFPGTVVAALGTGDSIPRLNIGTEQLDLGERVNFLTDTIKNNFLPGGHPVPTPVRNQDIESFILTSLGLDDDPQAKNFTAEPWYQQAIAPLRTRADLSPITPDDVDTIQRALQAGCKAHPEDVLRFALFTQFLQQVGPDGRSRAFAFTNKGAFGSGATYSTDLSRMVRDDPNGAKVLSMWTVRIFQRIYDQLIDAQRVDDRAQVLNLLRSYTAMPSYPILNEHRTQYNAAVTAIQPIRDQNRNQLLKRSIQIETGSLPRAIPVFSEGASIDTYLAPTDAFLVDRQVGNRDVVGTVQYDPTSQSHDVILSFSAQLAVDDLVAELVKDQLSPWERSQGLFANWQLDAEPLTFDGLKDSRVTFAGSVVNVRLTLDGRQGTTALWQLTSDQGIPLVLKYKYSNDQNQTGDLPPINLSLNRRKHPPISVTAAGIKNTGMVPVRISYLEMPGGSVRGFDRDIEVQPGVTVAPPGIAQADLLRITVPPGAVSVVSPDPFSLNDFQNVDNVTLSGQVAIKNTLPVSNPGRPGTLQRVELVVKYVTAEGQPQETNVSLAPAGIDGSTATRSFVRFDQRPVHVFASGRALYDNGFDTIPEKEYPNGVTIDATSLH